MAIRRVRLLILLGVLGLLGAGITMSCGYYIHTRGPSLATRANAPAFALVDQNGKTVSLDDLTRQGPAAVVFYRGHW